VVDHRDFVMGQLGIGLVDVNPFLDDGLIVSVQGKAAAIERAGAFERSARLDLKHIVAAIALGIDPMTTRIAEKSRIVVVGPAAPVRKDAAIVVDVADENVSCRSISPYPFVTRGMPGEMHLYVEVVPCPRSAWSLRLASKIASYSGVSGASCPLPANLLISNRPGPPIGPHCPLKSG
jgi:hypothetical protein